MGKLNYEQMTFLKEQFYNLKNEIYKQEKKQINEMLHQALKDYEEKNIAYDIFVGYYDYDGMNLDKHINGNGADGEMIDNGFDFVDYLKDYYDDLDFSAMVQLQVRFDDLEKETLYIEYNGYELFYYIEETTSLYQGLKTLEKDFDERGEK
jgi:hypothetical protein